MTRIYRTADAFKNALEEKIRAAAGRGGDMNSVRQILVFERFLARMCEQFGDRVIVKGGVALELRLERARTTRDVDLRVSGSSAGLLVELQAAAVRELGDYLRFEISIDEDHPIIDGDGVAYEGQRFVARSFLAAKVYGQPFGVDVAFGDAMTVEPDVIFGGRLLDFIDISPPRLLVYPRITHVAEKLHAYTMPRPRPNSRVKDLPDIALLSCTGPFQPGELWAAIERTFAQRSTHAVPTTLPAPPEEWASRYAKLARDDDLPWLDLAAVFEAARAFLDPVLSRRLRA